MAKKSGKEFIFALSLLVAFISYLFYYPVKKMERHVLPANAKPRNYHIHLCPNLETFIFEGKVTVTLDIISETDTLVLNTNELTIKSAKATSIVGKTQQEFDASDISVDEKDERVTFKFPSAFPTGSVAKLFIEFSGTHNDKLSGFYRSSFTGKNGEKEYMVVTQFEATDARKAFPCWDEPALKATFDVELTVKKNLVALANMDAIGETVEGEFKTIKFSTSPIMSTYLVAFAVGEFEYIEGYTSGESNGKPIKCRIYTPPGLKDQGKFALEVTVKTLEYYAEIFGTPYPLPKMDQIAVPDFDAGAMENWGLVTYRTVYLLFDEKSSTASTKMNVASVVNHELAHQWFGNLVTMEWWSELWLNEGFATWVSWLACDRFFPEWQTWPMFVAMELQRGLALDAMRSSHPIQVEVQEARQISQIFDAISYSKGASVIRMLASHLGIDTFLAGIRRYLKKYAFGNASTKGLWDALSEESGVNVEEFMKLWTLQVGHPVLSVTEEGDCIKVSQRRFLSTGDVTEQDDQQTWWVPIHGISKNGKLDVAILSEKSASIKADLSSWVKLNAGHSGVYRVNYSTSLIQKLATAIANNELEIVDRVGLIADAASLAESGDGSTTALLELFKSFKNEKEYIVWSELSSRLESINDIWSGEPNASKLDNLSKSLFAPLAKSLGWDYPAGESELAGMLRTLTISNAAKAGDEEIIKQCFERFEKFLGGDESAVHPNLRGRLFSAVVKNGGVKEWEDVKKIYETTTTADQKLAALAALGSTKVEECIQKTLEYSLNEAVRSQDIVYVYRGLAANSAAKEQLWNFVSDKWNTLDERYAGSLGLLGAIVKMAAGSFTTMEDASRVEKFFSDKDQTKISRPLQQTLEKISVRSKWLERSREEVSTWLSSNNF